MNKPLNGGPQARPPKKGPLNQREPAYGSVDSWALITLAQGGDKEAFGMLYERYHAAIFHRMLKGNVDYHTAEDLAAEVFVKALRNIGQFADRGADPSRLLYTIAHNQLVSHYRWANYRFGTGRYSLDEPSRGFGPTPPPGLVQQSGVGHDTSSPLHLEVVDLDADPAGQLFEPGLVEALRELRPTRRQAVVLRILCDLSTTDTARMMGCTEGAVKGYLSRGLKDLAEVLAGKGITRGL